MIILYNGLLFGPPCMLFFWGSRITHCQ